MDSNPNDVIRIKIDPEKRLRLPTSVNRASLTKTSSLSEYLLHIDAINNKQLWEKQAKKLRNLSNADNLKTRNCNHTIVDEKTAVLSLIDKFYNLNVDDYSLAIHLLPLNSHTFNERTSEFLLEYNRKNTFNLYSLMLFNKNLLNYEKLLFIFYQLLHVIREANCSGVNVGEIFIKNLYLDESFFLKIQVDLAGLIKVYEIKDTSATTVTDNVRIQIERFTLSLDMAQLYDSYRHLDFTDLSRATVDWCLGKLANFYYLIILNCISGRELNSPHNHPIFPWVYDFKTNLRDLRRTKFRLNKGDQHLDITYQASGCSYHVTELQSDITFYVYKSRCTDKTVLCKHVRSKWVPNEYPLSMERLYDWTPVRPIF
jgi:hypothetical protein